MDNEIIGCLDFPYDGIQINQSYMSIIGWAFSKESEFLKIEILLDEKRKKKTITDLARFDVYNKFQTERSYESGFFSKITIKNLPDGKYRLKVIARSKTKEKILGVINFKKGGKTLPENKFPNPRVVDSVANDISIKKAYIQFFIKAGKLHNDYTVLEIGCGTGRLAIPFTRYLNKRGKYYGLDIIPDAINYCETHISKRFPNFHFVLSDVKNSMYNPGSENKASELKLPFKDEFFDFVFLHSVFTHMLPEDVENYLFEISRVLKKGKRSCISFLLLNEGAKLASDDNLYKFNLNYSFPKFRSINRELPEQAIGYEESFIRKLFEKARLRIEEPIHWGSWRGTHKSPLSQDIVVSVKI